MPATLLWPNLQSDLDPPIHKSHDSGNFKYLFNYNVSVPFDDPHKLHTKKTFVTVNLRLYFESLLTIISKYSVPISE